MKKIMLIVALCAVAFPMFAAEPVCEVKNEYWGRQYIQLTDVNGFKYKVAIPSNGQKVKVVTRTGWYLIDANAKIVDYKDTGKVSKK